MRINKAVVTNFGSFKQLEFDFSTPGLHLIHGDTGSGKSTLVDVTSWILYGETPKGGNADDIRSWTSEEPTVGVLEVDDISVTRKRVGRAGNDLFWTELTTNKIVRGKDVTETQKLLQARLGISVDCYNTGGYYGEFSSTRGFFVAKAKERRALLEQIACLDFPIKLNEKLSDDKKRTKKTYVEVTTELHMQASKVSEMQRMLRDIEFRSGRFDQTKQEKIATIEARIKLFTEKRVVDTEALVALTEAIRSKIYAVSKSLDVCPTCDNATPNVEYYQNERLKTELQKAESNLSHLLRYGNPHLDELEAAKSQLNPFTEQYADLKDKAVALDRKINITQANARELSARLSSVDRLIDLTNQLKATILTLSVAEVQSTTNKYLETHFDSEFRISLEISGPDNLEVIIQKSGHEAAYRQLSKGQRSLLSLCFSLAIMKVSANRLGVHFNTLFFDEALDGLDSTLKARAFGLFQRLNLDHQSIFVVEHEPEFQNLFDTKYYVRLEGDESEIYEQ